MRENKIGATCRLHVQIRYTYNNLSENLKGRNLLGNPDVYSADNMKANRKEIVCHDWF
jgi:hypothetical protein